MTDQLAVARFATDRAGEIVERASAHLAHATADDGRISIAKLDRHQVLAYDLAR